MALSSPRANFNIVAPGLTRGPLAFQFGQEKIELAQWTGEQTRLDKRGKLEATKEQSPVPDALWSVANHPKQWLRQVQGTESQYYRAIGSAEALMLKAAEMGQQWMKGISDARLLQLIRQQPTA